MAFGDFGPRFGAAYRVNDSWVIRTGYGLMYFEQSGMSIFGGRPVFLRRCRSNAGIRPGRENQGASAIQFT